MVNLASILLCGFLFQNSCCFVSNVTLTIRNFTAVANVKPNFLSFALDSHLIKKHWCTVNWGKLTLLSKALAPGYLRIGGTDADGLIFDPNEQKSSKSEAEYCTSYVQNQIENFTMSAQQWNTINKFSRNARLNLIFDFNILLRNTNRTWNFENAELLLQYSQERKFPLNFELGNEPNHLNVHTNISETAEQLAIDYQMLKKLIREFEFYKSSLIIGPSVTQLDSNVTINYFDRFFKSGGAKVVDAATFHHYYFNGKNATIDQFLNPTIFDSLTDEIDAALKVLKKYSPVKKMKVWLGETASAYGSGAPGLSDSFASTFIWMDKLGLSAAHGVDVVIRQALFYNAYALLDKNTDPNPDFWLSLIYKRLFLPNVVKVFVNTKKKLHKKFVRFYAHCSVKRMTIFGMNLLNGTIKLHFNVGHLKIQGIKLYLLTAESLTSKIVFLNGERLFFDGHMLPVINGRDVEHPIYLPKYSLAFFTIILDRTVCCL